MIESKFNNYKSIERRESSVEPPFHLSYFFSPATSYQ